MTSPLIYEESEDALGLLGMECEKREGDANGMRNLCGIDVHGIDRHRDESRERNEVRTTGAGAVCERTLRGRIPRKQNTINNKIVEICSESRRTKHHLRRPR